MWDSPNNKLIDLTLLFLIMEILFIYIVYVVGNNVYLTIGPENENIKWFFLM